MERKSHKIRNVFLIILLIIVLVIAGMLVWQKDNIAALHKGATVSTEEIESSMQENQAAMDEAASGYDVPDITLSEDEVSGLIDGTLKAEDVAEGIINNEGTLTSSDAEVQKLITAMYVLKDGFKTGLQGLMKEAETEYAALPAEQQTGSAKRGIVMQKLSKAYAMEDTCDVQVKRIVSEIEDRLGELGQDTSLAAQVQDIYDQQKELMKSYYISEYL